MKFRTRLFLFYIIGVGLMTVVLAAYFINFEENRVRATTEANLLTQAKLIAAKVAGDGIENSRLLSKTVSEAARETEARVTVIDSTGKVWGDSAEDPAGMENHRDRPEISKSLSGATGTARRRSETLGRDLIYIACPVKADGRIIGVVRLAKDQQELDRFLFRLRLLIILSVLGVALFALFCGRMTVRRFTDPINELQRVALRFAQGDLGERVRYFGRDELADLGMAFNNMARRLANSFAMLEAEKRKLEVILETLSDGILVVDRELKIMMVNGAAAAILGLGARNVQGRPVMEVVLNHHLVDLIQNVNSNNQAWESELNLYYPQNRQLQVFLAPLKDETGMLAGSVVALHDISQLRHLERVRQDFVGNVSHELRTPITSMKAMAETLLAGAKNDEATLVRYLAGINQECDRLSNLIKDLLDLAKLDSKPEVNREAFDLIELLKEVRESFLPNNGPAPELTLDLPAEILPKVLANRGQIKQVLLNLLDNAFKYTTANGQVRLSACREGDWVKVEVADTGIGIPQEELSRIFERFYRVDKARSRAKGGTGLGLSIVKHIVEGHGGKVEVESRLNQGSVFSFTVPAAKNTKD
ncbi:MAG: ATP-binding protein [Bacteroidota bacterium]